MDEITRMESLLDDMEKGILSPELLAELKNLDSKRVENEKLKYRLNILKRASEATSHSVPPLKQPRTAPKEKLKVRSKYLIVEDSGDSIFESLRVVFTKSVYQNFPDMDLEIAIKETTNKKFGDYQFEMCNQISRRLQNEKGIKKSPNEVAKRIAETLPKIPLIKKIDVVNFFINIYISEEHICKRMCGIFLRGITLPKLSKLHAVVDFSSPNIAKQMHVGHLRSTIIGESISRLLELVGFSVLRLNHIGDWGTQFGMLIAYLKDVFPDYMEKTPPIQDLQRFYKESKVKFDEDQAFKSRAYQCVVKLQNHEPDIVKAWELICDVSRKDFANIYKRLNIQLIERGESFYQSRMQSMVKELDEMGLLTEEDGRKLYFPKSGGIPLTVVKSDGGYTYDSSDLATLRQRIQEEHGDWILYVVDRGQGEHFQSLFSAAKDFGWYEPEKQRVEHIEFGVVLGEDNKKFKTRSGETVKLTNLLDEGLKRAEEKLLEKNRQEELSPDEFQKAKESVAYGCIKYSDLSTGRTADYVFSFDRMLDDRGNTAVYLLYAYARIRSIIRTAQVSPEKVIEYVHSLNGSPLPLSHPRELELAKHILKFSDCLLFVLESLQLHKICDYVYGLATLFHDFYKECYVITKIGGDDSQTVTTTINFHRLVLCEVTSMVCRLCFEILGINPLDKM